MRSFGWMVCVLLVAVLVLVSPVWGQEPSGGGIDPDVRVELDTAAAERAALSARLEALEAMVHEHDEDVPVDPPDPPDVEDPADGFPVQAGHRPWLGFNVFSPVYWAPPIYADLARQADDWRADGRSYVVWGLGGMHPAGLYTLTWEGSGTIGVHLNGAAVVFSGPGLLVFDLPGREDRNNPPKGILLEREGEVGEWHLWLPGHAPGEEHHGTFWEPWLAAHREAGAGVLRWMDWLNTNGSTDRPDWQRVDDLIEACVLLGAEPHVCMGHLWSDADVREFARRCRDGLPAGRRVWVEWSNEVWNPAFDVNGWAEGRGEDLVDTWAVESRRVFGLWREVYEGRETQVVRCVFGQRSNPRRMELVAERLGVGGFDVLGCSGYFGLGKRRDIPADATVDVLLDLYAQQIEDHEAGRRAHAELAADYGALFACYEAGQHATADGRRSWPWFEAYVELQTHPRLYELYHENLRQLRSMGCVLFNHYADFSEPTPHGAWGAAESPTERGQSVKWRALMEFDWNEDASGDAGEPLGFVGPRSWRAVG